MNRGEEISYVAEHTALSQDEIGIGKSSYSVRKILRYLMVLFLVLVVFSVFVLLEDYLNFLPLSALSSKHVLQTVGGLHYLGYLGFLLLMILSPLPDYVLVTLYGYLSALDKFNPVFLLLIASFSMTLYLQSLVLAARYGGRPALLKFLKYFRVSEQRLATSENWVQRHGAMAVFAFTFIPFLQIGLALTCGLLKMSQFKIFLANLFGFALRYALLLYLGFYSYDILSGMLNINDAFMFYIVLSVAAVYLTVYSAHALRRNTKYLLHN